MKIFWDTSAFLPMILMEETRRRSARIWETGQQHIAWDWFQVEAESACVRQNLTSEEWHSYRIMIPDFIFLPLESGSLRELLTFNRSLKLRSADAGHLFVLTQFLQVVPDAVLATYDREMLEAAHTLALPVHPLCLEA